MRRTWPAGSLEVLGAAGMDCGVDPARGLDHGAWVPLLLMYPQADIPVLQISVQSHLGPEHHLALGRALATLPGEDVLVIGSGSFTHDLSRFRGHRIDDPAQPDVIAFADWLDQALTERRVADLLAYRQQAPYAERNHPTEEHLLPLYRRDGGGRRDAAPRRLHISAQFSILRMDAYAFATDAAVRLRHAARSERLAARRGSPALARAWCRRRCAAGGALRCAAARYPDAAPRPGDQRRGAVVDVNAAALRRLQAYEGPAYRLTRVVGPGPRGGETAAFAWIAPAATSRPW